MIKRQPLKHNVIDRDKILVPPNWDSWGKIRVLRDGFDVEAVSRGWSLDIEEKEINNNQPTKDDEAHDKIESSQNTMGAVQYYENYIQAPSLDTLQATVTDSNSHKLMVSCQDSQEFLAEQLEALENHKVGTDFSGTDSSHQIHGQQLPVSTINGENHGDEAKVNEHIGPIQFNMGGIQVDADDILQKLKV